MSEKSQWGSKLGFILASAGSAIGLGAVWKFPYMTAANGGRGFLLVFLISTLLIGFPLLLAEFALGRSAGVSAIKTFGKLGNNQKYNFIGWIGAFALFILLSFYSVIGGWILVYLGIEFGRLFHLIGNGDYAQQFSSIISNPIIALGAQASFIFLNISVSIMAGLAIFPAMSAFNIQSEGGPSLLFIVLPQLFDNMPFGTIFYILFLLLFLFATITSSVVMLEINVGNITNQDNRKRAKWSMILGVLTFVFGIPSALSYGVMADIHIFGKTFFDAMDFLVSNLLMPFGALCLSLFTGYIFKKTLAMEELHLDETPWKQGLFQVWLFLLRFIIPIMIIVVFIAQFM